ncbi:MAG: hypothetical protein OXE42_02870 [Gammaproteobacteria bacterium]|nr:hypothetical protein [Gammaproteobacteria bacterium]
MKTQEDVEILEKTIGQLDTIYIEISLLSKKSPNDAVNTFKLKLINSVLQLANTILGDGYKPFDEFEQFNKDDVPSTSDVVFVISQYRKEIKRFREDNIARDQGRKLVYILNGELSGVHADPNMRN